MSHRRLDRRANDIVTVNQRRQERELFFWTARQTLALVLLVACTIGAIAAVMNGEMEILLRAIAVLLS
jgi:uncharacterized integral membrane protein